MKQQILVKTRPVFHVMIDNMFGSEINREIFNHIISLKDKFELAKTGKNPTANKNIRSNLTCYIDTLYYRPDLILPDGTRDWPGRRTFRSQSPLLREVDNLFENNAIIKDMMESSPYPLCKFRHFNTWETQVSRYGSDNQFYHWHKDRLDSDARLISLVYYLHKSSKKFHGGELSLSENLLHGNTLVGEGESVDIEPKNDRLVIFGSRTPHSVKPTTSPNVFDDGRFSINIWAGRLGPLLENDQF